MKKVAVSLLQLLFLLSFLNPTLSLPVCYAETSWKAIGPFGGGPRIVLDPINSETLYTAGLTGGAFKSLNGGAGWIDITYNLPYGVVSDLAVTIDTTSKKTVLYALVFGKGLFRTTDGEAWSALNSGLDLYGSSIAFDPADGNTLYLASDSAIYKSTNGGSNWTTIKTGDFDGPEVILADSHTVYVGDRNAGVLKSTDGGSTWRAMNDGLAGKAITAIAIDAALSQTLYATTFDHEVYRSTNGGTSWSPFSSGVPLDAIGPRMPVGFDPSNKLIGYKPGLSGIQKTCDGGSVWKLTSPGPPLSVSAVAVHPSTSQTVFAATDGGLYKSENGGSSWRPLSDGLGSDPILAVAIAPNGSEMFASTYLDFFRSTDGGEHWTRTTTSGLKPANVSSIVIPPTSGNKIIYATGDIFERGVLKSSDDGATWSLVNDGLPPTESGELPILALAADPTNASVIYAVLGERYPFSMYKSATGGGNWSLLSSLPTEPYTVAVSQINGNSIVYAGTYTGIFISNDAGASWSASNTGLPLYEYQYLWVEKIIVDPADTLIVYAWVYNFDDGEEYLYRSIDGGQSWSQFSTALPTSYVYNFAVDAANSQTLYAATFGGIMRTITETTPAITVPASATFSIGVPGALRATATGWPAPTISVSGIIPNGLSFDPSSGTLSGAPSVGSAGTYELTFTASTGLPPDASRAVAVNVLPSPGQLKAVISPFASPLTSLPVISGTASGPGLAKVEVQVTDGTYYLQSDGTLRATGSPTWVLASGTGTWSLNTFAVAWVEGVTYTVTARASSSGAQAVISSSFRIEQNTAKQRVLLSALATPDTLNAGGTAAIRGRLTRANLSPLAGQIVTVIVSPPSTKENPFPPQNITSYTTDDYGAFKGADVPYSTAGVYAVQVRFDGSRALQPALASLSLPVVAQSGYAIIVVGKAPDNSLLKEHTKTATAIYTALTSERRFLDDDIKQLISDADKTVTKQEIRGALAALKEKFISAPAPVYLIMIDHGVQSGFMLGGTSSDQVLTPAELSQMLDDFEKELPAKTLEENERFLIMASCYSGQFQTVGSKPGRVVLTSAAANERSLVGSRASATSSDQRGGDYYLDALCTYLGRGDSFAKAHAEAANDVTFADPRNYNDSVPLALHSGVVDTDAQHPLLNDNGDSVGSFRLDGGTDGSVTANLFLGEGIRVPATGNPADIVATSPTVYLDSVTTSAAGQGGTWLKVNENSKVGRAWIEIRNPGTYVTSDSGTGQVIPGNLDSVSLTFDGEKWVDLTNYLFSRSGRYDIYYHTTDDTNQPSPMARSRVYRNRAGNTPPDPFTLDSPINTTVDPSFGLLWKESRDSDGVTYTVVISTDSSFDSNHVIYREEDIAQPMTMIAKDALKNPSGRYYCRSDWCYWKVKAVDGFGMVTESATFGTYLVNETTGLNGYIDGYVTNEATGLPIPGATVTIGAGNGSTASNGGYLVFVPDVASVKQVSVTADGFATKLSSVAVSAGSVSRVNFSLTPVMLSQSITGFAPPASAIYGGAIHLSASATSGLPVTFMLVSGPGTISNNILTITGVGTVTVKAMQGGDWKYYPATDIERTITANKAVLTVTAADRSRLYNTPNPPLGVYYSGFVNNDTAAVLTGSPSLSTTADQSSPPGTYIITVTQGSLASANYSFAFVNGLLEVTASGKAGRHNILPILQLLLE